MKIGDIGLAIHIRPHGSFGIKSTNGIVRIKRVPNHGDEGREIEFKVYNRSGNLSLPMYNSRFIILKEKV